MVHISTAISTQISDSNPYMLNSLATIFKERFWEAMKGKDKYGETLMSRLFTCRSLIALLEFLFRTPLNIKGMDNASSVKDFKIGLGDGEFLDTISILQYLNQINPAKMWRH